MSLAAVCTALAIGCDDDNDSVASLPDENGGVSGDGGTSGAGSDKASPGEGGLCDCGSDPRFVHVPLECAEEHGLITTFEDDLKAFQRGTHQLGIPYYVLHGACDDGYRTLEFSEATENGGVTTYDPLGKLVYRSYGPYSSPNPVCTHAPDSSFGDFGIGLGNPAQGCTYCLVDSDREGIGGAPPNDPEYDTQPCSPAELE